MEAPWALLGRVLRVAPVPEEGAEAEPAAAADEVDFSIPLALPPRVTVLTANPSAHPEPAYPDRYPYVVAASAFCVLINFSVLPFHGVQFGDHPHEPHLVLLRERELRHPEAGVCTSTAKRVPARHGSFPIIYNLESIGIVTLRVGAANEDHGVAELFVDRGRDTASVAYWFAEGYHWYKKDFVYPLAAYRDRDWVPSGVVSHDEKSWWFDLSWGLLSCDFAALPNTTLLFHDLPEGRALDASRPDIRHRRCITESGDALRYVEIVPDHEGDAAPTVCSWTGMQVPNDDGHGILVWAMGYAVSFEEIWDDNTYTATGLPRKVPVLTAVCPSNPAVVYFSLEQEQRLFGVHVPLHRVVQFVDEAYDLVMPWPAPLCSRYVLPWLLPRQVLQALGINPFMDEQPGATKSREDAPGATKSGQHQDATDVSESGDDTIGFDELGDNTTGSQESGDDAIGHEESGDDTAGSQESGDDAIGPEESGDDTGGSQDSGARSQESVAGASGVTESGGDATEVSESGDDAIWSEESGDNTAGSQESGDYATEVSDSGDDAIGSEESEDNTDGSQESRDYATDVSNSGDDTIGSEELGDNTVGSQESGDDATEDSSE